jgi:hypothetical protein
MGELYLSKPLFKLFLRAILLGVLHQVRFYSFWTKNFSPKWINKQEKLRKVGLHSSRLSTTDGLSLAIINRKFKNLDFKFIVNLKKTKRLHERFKKSSEAPIPLFAELSL